MKKLLIGLTLVSISMSSFADCVDVMKFKAAESGGVFAGSSIISVPAAAVAPFTGGISLVIPGLLVGGTGIRYGIRSKRVKKLIEVIEQSKKCSGNEIHKLYKKYQKSSDDNISMSDFCYRIEKANETGELCKGLESVRSKDIIKFTNL
ncbi:MAG: hypothetical protein N4A33_01770 [Bacteriovoracaceae bacterium]|jgi:hypothetical protein|nr:hypothetical protein [Bacteriovoracaceae bacterium]